MPFPRISERFSVCVGFSGDVLKDLRYGMVKIDGLYTPSLSKSLVSVSFFGN